MKGGQRSDLLQAEWTKSRWNPRGIDIQTFAGSSELHDDATWSTKLIEKMSVQRTSAEPIANLNQRRRRYRGDEYGSLLAAWLNEMTHGRRNQCAYRRANRLLKTVLQLTDVPGDQTRLQKIATSIEKQLRPYSSRPHCFMMRTQEAGSQGETLERIRPFFQAVPSGGQTTREHAAVDAILELSQRALLSDIRRCDSRKCRRWLYARFAHQHFCSERCKNEYCDSKEFKLKHAAKQKITDELKRSGKAV